MIKTLFAILLALTAPPSTTKFENGLVLMSNVTFATIETQTDEPRELRMDVAFPMETTATMPAVIFVHGGGWSSGKKEDGAKVISTIARGGYFAAAIEYRLADEAGFPAAVHDCKAAIRFIRSNASSLGVDATRIGIVGLSAGGHLAALVGMSTNTPLLDGSINGDDISTAVSCIGTISGAVMPHLAGGRGKAVYERWAVVNDSVKLQDTLPSTHLDKDDPPIYLLCGEDDFVCPVQDTQQFVEYLEEVGIEHHIDIVAGSGHSIQDPKAYLGILGFLDQHLGGRAANALRAHLDQAGRSRGR